MAYFRSPSGDGAKLIAYAATDETANAGQSPEGLRGHEPLVRRPARRELDTSGSDIGRLFVRIGRSRPLYLSPAYRPWLEGTGELPEGLAPLPLKEGGG